MKQESFRIYSGTISEQGNSIIKNFSSSFFQGESTVILSNNSSELQALKKLFSSNSDSFSGRILINNKPAVPEILSKNCFIADGKTLIDSLKVYENIFILRNRRNRKLFSRFPIKSAVIESQNILKQISEKTVDVNEELGNLTPFEKMTVNLCQALTLPQPIVLIDLSDFTLDSQNTELFRTEIRALRSNNKCIILLSGHHTEFAVCADKVIILNQGIIQKTFENDEIIQSVINKCFSDMLPVPIIGSGSQDNQALCSVTDQQNDPVFSIQKGEVTGVWDPVWQFETLCTDYINKFISTNRFRIQYPDDKTISEPVRIDLRKNNIAIIPSNLEKSIFFDLPISHNILMPVYPNISLFPGRVNPETERYVLSEYLSQFGIDIHGDDTALLNYSQLQLLLLYRASFMRADFFIIESPDRMLDFNGQNSFQHFIETQKTKGNTFLLFSGNLFFLQSVSSKIIIANNHVFERTIVL